MIGLGWGIILLGNFKYMVLDRSYMVLKDGDIR